MCGCVSGWVGMGVCVCVVVCVCVWVCVWFVGGCGWRDWCMRRSVGVCLFRVIDGVYGRHVFGVVMW